MKCLIASDSRGFMLEKAFSRLPLGRCMGLTIDFVSKPGATIQSLTAQLRRHPCIRSYDLILFNAGVNNLSFRAKNGIIHLRFDDPYALVAALMTELAEAQHVLHGLNRNVALCTISGLDVDRYNAHKGKRSCSLASQAALNKAMPHLNDAVSELNRRAGMDTPDTAGPVHSTVGGTSTNHNNYHLMYDGLHPKAPLADSWADILIIHIRRFATTHNSLSRNGTKN